MRLLGGRPLTGEQLRLRARRDLDRGDRAAALMALETAVKAEPEVVENHVRLGCLLMSYGSPEAARQAFNAALVLDRSCAEARRALNRLPSRPAQVIGFAVGDTIGGVMHSYQITGIRTGGFSVVYLAEFEATGARAPVALKTVTGQMASLHGNRQRVTHEAAAWLKLPPHPHVVTALMFDYLEGLPCLVLEHVDGHDLGSVLATGALPAPACIDYAMQICDAMTFLAHHRIKSHGDLTPANCLLDNDNCVRLTDFGAAAAAREAEAVSHSLGLLRPETARRYVTQPDTAHYLPPEWLRFGQRTMRGDLYSFGVLLFELLGGRPEDAVQAVRSGQPDAWPPRLTDLIRRCTESSPRRRPRSFAAVRAELAALHLARPTARAPQPRRAAPVVMDQVAEEQATAALHQLRGVSLLTLNRFHSAYRVINSAVRLDPQNSATWALKANLHRTLRQDRAASDAAEHAERLLDGSPGAALAVACMLARTEDLTRVVTVIKPALDSPTHVAQACSVLCAAAAEAGRWDDCVTWADQALGHRPANLHLLLAAKALGLYFRGQGQDALAIAAEVTERRPFISLAWVVLSLVHLAHGDLAAADGSIARVRDLSGVVNAAATWALCGRLAEAHGRYDEAGRSAVEARAALAEADPVDRHIAAAVLADGAWVQRALDQSKRLGDLVARARARPKSPEALALIAQAAQVDAASRHVEDGFWAVIRDLGGLQSAIDLARTHFSGPELDGILHLVASRVENAQSTSAT